MKLAGGGLSPRLPVGTFRGAFGKPGFSAAPVKTVAPIMARQPGTYGGPAGSFITRGGCPPGYSRIAMPRGPSQPQEYRCVPRVAASTPPPSAPSQPASSPVVSPVITVSPVMQQAFTPQFSPVMTMQQDSPGAQVKAAPIQAAAPEQAAKTAAPVPPPTAPSLPVEPAPVATGPAPFAEPLPAPIPAPAPMPVSPGGWPVQDDVRTAITAEQGKGLNPWLLAAAGVGLFLITRQPKEGRKK